MMKRLWGMTRICTAGALCRGLALGAWAQGADMAIIGGADGPTVIFTTGDGGEVIPILAGLTIILIGSLLIAVFGNGKH